MIIIALRRLKKFFDDEFASKKDKIDFLEYRKFANASLHDKLFYAILQNYDFISYFFCLDNITELDIASEYDLFMKTSPIYSKIAIMPTKSKFYQDLAKYSDRFNKHNAKKPSFESAEFAISTVLSEFEKANQSLNQHKEYKLMKMDYEDLKKIVLQKENQLTYVN